MGDHTVVNYCFQTLNNSCTKDIRAQGEYIILYVLLFLISASTVFLNLLVVIAVSHFKQLHTPTNLLLLSLAVADLLVGFLVMPVEGMRLIERCWYFGDTFCYIFPLILFVVISASLGNLVFISVDRYIAVSNALNYYSYITLNKAVLCIFFSWFGSFVYSVLILSNHLLQPEPHRTCHGECLLVINFSWIIADLFVSFTVPCSIVICLYLKIFSMAKHQTLAINSVRNPGMTTNENVKIRKSVNKAARTLGILVAVYLLCWIPYYVSILANGSISSSSFIVTFLSWTMYMNSCMNPLIYALFYPWFRVSIKHILTLGILDPTSPYYSVYPDDV
ncbi:hypothetical protein ACEWY4_009191 [Coilia grayii]|uniref:G-protein coupled receptors family 1 profile domain-containing protein n=1 Tax=Coilia grayii TaxID=363190 RepID=A0ABD1K5R9_9TELE